MMDDPSTRRTERIMKQSDEPNWRSRKWEKPIQEVESPSIVPKTEMSIKLENDDEQNQRSRLKELITQRLEAQSIALAAEQENDRNQRSRLEEIIKRKIESQTIAQTQTPFIEEMESDEEDQETETEGDTVETPAEQKKRLIQAYLTSTMEEEETTEEQNERRKLIHAYSKCTMDNNEEQTEQDETETYLRTSMEEEQEPSTWEEYDEEEPFGENEEDKSSKENDDEGKWMTQFSYPTKEEEDALFIAFMTGTVEDQRKWIDAKMNMTRATTNEETRKREEEILNRIIPTGIVDLDEAFEEEDKEETDDLTEDQEEDFAWQDYQVYPFSLFEQEKTDELIDENTEEEDIQSLESLNISYQDHRRQDEETVNSLTTEPDGQLDKARYFTELDVRWKYDDRHTEDEDQWKINFETNQKLFEPMVILSRLYSPTTSQAKTDEMFLNQKNKCRIDIDNNSETKELNTENTGGVPRRSRNNNPFTEPEGCTPWVARTEHGGLLNSGNQPQTGPIKLNGIAEWTIPTTTMKEVKSFLGFRNFDKEFTQNEEDLTKSKNKQNEKGQDNCNIIMLPERLFPDQLDQELDDEQTFENNDEQFDPITTLSVQGLKTLPNHFSKVTAATYVNNVIAVNVTNVDLRKWITMARIVKDMMNSLLGKRPNIWKDRLEDWLVWILRAPNKNTAYTNHSTLRYSKTIQMLNGKRTKQNLFLSNQPDRYMGENTDNQDGLLSSNGTLVRTIDEKLYKLIEENGNMQNIFYAPMEGILLPWDPLTPRRRGNNLLFYVKTFDLGIHPGPLSMDLLQFLKTRMVMEDHGSTAGVISRILKIPEPHNDGTTTISLDTSRKQYELSAKSISHPRTHSVLHKSELLLGFK